MWDSSFVIPCHVHGIIAKAICEDSQDGVPCFWIVSKMINGSFNATFPNAVTKRQDAVMKHTRSAANRSAATPGGKQTPRPLPFRRISTPPLLIRQILAVTSVQAQAHQFPSTAGQLSWFRASLSHTAYSLQTPELPHSSGSKQKRCHENEESPCH